ncbi:MAG: Stp1/IreP family PP2C-type Ser/Thr phosphatase [Candidatus Hydrogenedentes bacterium]|nr:Stp1/IreP family PP2C-type Ser/Thr phosphatase [Candidatus Hydrogenedentota bacterium]
MAVIAQTHTGPEKGGNYEFHWCGTFLEAHLISDVGKKRSRNEDSCALCVPDDRQTLNDRGILLAVADGMGGVSGGDFASRLALQTLAEEYYTRRESTTPARLSESVSQANRRIFQEAENHPEYYGMGTTMSAILILGDHAYIAQVGDSRVYLLRKSERIWQITDDHSLVAEQVRNGYISEQEARTHSLKNLITRAVGTKEAVTVDLFAVQLKQGDTLLICSDGLSNVVEDNELAKAMSDGDSLQAVARVLVGRALQAGAPDNVTAVLIRVTETPPRTKLEPGAQKVGPARTGLFGVLRKLIS